MNIDELAGRVYEERQRLGMTLENVEEVAGISWHTVQRFENGKNIKLDSLLMILAGLGLELVIPERKP